MSNVGTWIDKGKAKMINVVIWGAGTYCEHVLSAIRRDRCNLIGIVDSKVELQGELFREQIPLYPVNKLAEISADYIVVSVQDSKSILEQFAEMKIPGTKIIDYWHTQQEYDFIDSAQRKIFLLEKELADCKCQIRNMPYELGVKLTPVIKTAEELLKLIIKEKKSLSRFGDGELEIMQNRARPWFQDVDEKLASRLRQVFQSEDERIVIALADNFGNLDKYTEKAAMDIRRYLDNGIREELMKDIDLQRNYYDAYVTRPYIIYENKEHAKDIFELFKKIWTDRKLVIVEGRTSRIGVCNDLFDGVAEIKRILAPSKNAFHFYDEIYKSVKRHVNENALVLISLGPTATILAYDLAIEGIQALDIGQLDNEYEWYKRGALKQMIIPGKMVSEVVAGRTPEMLDDADYLEQIVEVIG